MVVVAGVLAAAVGITAVAVHIHRPPDARFDDRTAVAVRDLPIWLPTPDPYPYGLTPTPPPTTTPPAMWR